MARPEHKKDLATLLRLLVRQGWRIEPTRRGHFKCYAPCGSVVIAGGSGDWRALRNSKALLRRHGAKV